jgi:hypothetical protein
MAGETSKTLIRTDFDNKKKVMARLVRGRAMEAREYHAFTATQLEAADVLLTGIKIPSNAILSEILMYNDDLDSNACPTLAFDIGLYATAKFISTTSSTDTTHAADAVLDADLFVDGDTTAQAATTKLTSLALDSGTCGPDDLYKSMWELLGYDNDPRTEFGVVITAATAAATAAAGDMVLVVRYVVD